ncbi:hypothetical protein AQUCO_00201327v1 [Aquilegia coerulea]|uniref:C2H2-type domain-containing protein n=2 Tax=Aquilegia coerulea TaxID=218851 RepID=A0A2G5F7C6_AQUCA|nr:hypothetical protein AQUCO_00201327v1 [Aquilegia coerulea]
MEGREREEAEKRKPIGKDIRRYYCQYCGIGRSKKALINSHILSHHKEEIEREKENCEYNEMEETKSNTCEECGASFRKPAYLKQHMQSHSFERPYACTVDDCHSSYKREDHLTRHLLQHQGKLFSCPVEGCTSRFAYLDNMKRHVIELHDETDSDSCDSSVQKQLVCPEVGCGKVFRYASRLRKHEESHVKLDSVEAICCEPGCWKSFSNIECLKAHLQSSHLYINCEVCGTQQLKKNIKRHMRIHEAGYTSHRIKCSFKGCLHTFATKSNLNQHIKAVHLELRPFVCRFDGCGERFPYKHVRDNHEKSGAHVYIPGDFEEADAQFQSRPRGGKKRKYPTVEMLLRKRVVPPGQADSTSCQGSEYLAWLLSASDEDGP